MFTGIVEDLGTVQKEADSGLQIATALDDIKIGDSIAVNGICLTVTRLSDDSAAKARRILEFDASPETLERTNLGKLRVGTQVNLERALQVGSRLGGHFLSGHIEEVGRILSVRPAGNSLVFTFSSSRELNRYIAPKGSVGVDGISLTVTGKDTSSFSVAVIPHTLKNTTLGFKTPGAEVNLEPDMLAKYIASYLNPGTGGITERFLKENGFH